MPARAPAPLSERLNLAQLAREATRQYPVPMRAT
jgi:hypothetical protein